MSPSASELTIRRANARDAAAFARTMGDAAVFPGTLQVPYTDEAIWAARLADSLAPGKADLLLVAERDGAVLGSAGLHPVGSSARRRHAMMLGITVASAAQGQGVGSALMGALCDYADRWAQVLRLELTVFVDNQRAIGLYRKFGFEVEGTHRAYALRNGAYCDVLAMARLHPNPPTLAAAASLDSPTLAAAASPGPPTLDKC
jgi:putative acetyltransferase